MSTLALLFLACATTMTPPPASSGQTAAVTASEAGPPPVSFAPLEERVNVLIADAKDTDRRDRLVAARELMGGMRNKDPIAQRKVYAYLDEVLTIEERAQPKPIPIEGLPAPIEEEVLTAPPPVVGADPAGALAEARGALAGARYLDAVAALSGVSSPEAAALRKEAVDGWARAEREAAGRRFLEARQLAPGDARVAALRAVRSTLAAINERFPENAYAAQIADNIAKVEADLVAAGALP